MLHTLPRPGAGLQTLPGTGQVLPSAWPAGPVPDPGVFAAAVTRYRAMERLREFRSRLYDCLARRADALFELADAVLCADHAVTSLVQLCLEPEFTRGHGALYDALSAGRIDDERLFSLLASELPQAVDGPQALAWIAGHDVIDHGLLDKALAALSPDDACQVRDACARWSRLRFAVDATAYPRPDAWCSPGREHVHNGACHCRGSSKTAPGWEYQFTAAIGHLRTAWAALTDVARTTPATRTEQTIAQVKNVLRRLRAAGHGRKQKGAAKENEIRTKRQGLQDIGAATDAAVQHDRHAATDGISDDGQRPQRRNRVIELAPAMVRYDDAINPAVLRGARIGSREKSLDH